jgi:hypothetical protein
MPGLSSFDHRGSSPPHAKKNTIVANNVIPNPKLSPVARVNTNASTANANVNAGSSAASTAVADPRFHHAVVETTVVTTSDLESFDELDESDTGGGGDGTGVDGYDGGYGYGYGYGDVNVNGYGSGGGYDSTGLSAGGSGAGAGAGGFQGVKKKPMINQYVILRKVGEGKHGTVMKCYDYNKGEESAENVYVRLFHFFPYILVHLFSSRQSKRSPARRRRASGRNRCARTSSG